MQENDEAKAGKKKKIAGLCLGTLAGLLLAEISLRAAGYSYTIFYTTDELRGYALKPFQEGWYQKEGASFVHINSQGLRDREHSLAKPGNTFRLAIVGDSYAEALQVDASEVFWSVLEKNLAQCAGLHGKQVEAVNFGVSGYGTAQELLTLREKVWSYQPDAVLLAFTTNNDVTDNVRALKKSDEIPYFVRHNGQLTLDDSFRNTKTFRLRNSAVQRRGRWLRDNLRVLHLAHQVQVRLKSWLAARRNATLPAGGDETGIENQIYQEPKAPVWLEAWQVTEALLATMNRETKEHQAGFYVFTLSNAIQVAPDANWRHNFMQRLKVNDLFYPDKRLAELGAREGFPVFNLAPELQKRAEAGRVFFHGFDGTGNGHWNAAGHRIAGELMARQLCPLISSQIDAGSN